MRHYISIVIPTKLKAMFNKEKENFNGSVAYLAITIQKALVNNDITTVYTSIISLNNINETRFILEKGFFKEYMDWLDFALKKLMTTQKIFFDKNFKDSYIYSLLIECQKQLDNMKSLNEIDKLITNAEIAFYNKNINIKYIPIIHDICRLFIHIGVGIINPKKLANLSYDAYLESK